MKLIPLTRGLFTKVDDEDFEKYAVYRWHAIPQRRGTFRAGRAACSQPKKTEYLHRVIMKAASGQYVDHINGDPLDNQKHNLRFCSVSENAANRGGCHHNRSGYKGVFKRKDTGQWFAQITCKGKQYYVSGHKTAEAAARAYDQRAKELFGKFAKLNFPQD